MHCGILLHFAREKCCFLSVFITSIYRTNLGIATTKSFNTLPAGEIYSPTNEECSKGTIDHAVVLLGFGSIGGNSYYVVQNSHGPEWSDHGIGRITRGAICGIETVGFMIDRLF